MLHIGVVKQLESSVSSLRILKTNVLKKKQKKNALKNDRALWCPVVKSEWLNIFGISEGIPPPPHHEIRSCFTNTFFCVSNVRNSCLKCLGSSVCRRNWIMYDNHWGGGGPQSDTIYAPQPTKPLFAAGLFIKPSVLLAVTVVSAERWGAVMDSVCYWGRRGVLHPLPPPPVNVCVCVCAHEEWRSWNLPALLLHARCRETEPLTDYVQRGRTLRKVRCSQPHGFCWLL